MDLTWDNEDEFKRKIDKAMAEKVLQRLVEFHKTVSQTTYSMVSADSRNVGLKYGSPVLSGRFSGSHTVSIGSPDRSVVPAAPSGTKDRVINAKPASYVRSVLEGLKPFEIVYITNALPYSRRLEFGHSRLKAPNGVYAVTAEVVKAMFKNVQGDVFIR